MLPEVLFMLIFATMAGLSATTVAVRDYAATEELRYLMIAASFVATIAGLWYWGMQL